MVSHKEYSGTLTRLGLEIDKKGILDEYSSRFGDLSAVVTKKQGERISLYQKHPPNNARLVCDHKMKPSLKKQYQVRDLTLNNVVVNLVRDHERYGLSSKDVGSIAMLSKIYSKMVSSVLELRELDSSPLLYPRLNYESQTEILQERVKMATASLIRHSMNPGMMIRELSGEYTGETRELDPILEEHVDSEDLRHMISAS